ncbi:hypothetical protein SDC9_188759 [bioreactor metagenome]|uniref:Uncharacterized protein n=1 Tax=bioreactor metagenome TaxID=1076179 RepID=A0A645HQG8_9ZZZZ
MAGADAAVQAGADRRRTADQRGGIAALATRADCGAALRHIGAGRLAGLCRADLSDGRGRLATVCHLGGAFADLDAAGAQRRAVAGVGGRGRHRHRHVVGAL